MVLVWSWLVVSRVSRLVKDLRLGGDADDAFDATEGAPLMLAEAVSRACADFDLRFPVVDAQMRAVLVRDGVSVPLDSVPTGAMVETTAGRLGLATNGGLIVSHGGGLSIAPLDQERVVNAWLIPGVAYLERVVL